MLTNEQIEKQRTEDFESGIIIQLDRLARVNMKLTKQLVVGCVESEVVGAYMDLRNIATKLETIVGRLNAGRAALGEGKP